MKTLILTIFLSVTAHATPAEDAFARIKSFAGNWDSEVGDVRYEIGAGGTSVFEYFGSMVSVYHLDGDSILMTHYCEAGNQPRMRATEFGDVLDFKFVDITNLKPEAHHISGLKLEQKGDVLLQHWREKIHTGEEKEFTFELRRRVPVRSDAGSSAERRFQ